MEVQTEKRKEFAMNTRTQNQLEETIGMESLFPLGGFIEETVKDAIKAAWKLALQERCRSPYVLRQIRNSQSDLITIVNETIDNYRSTPDEEGLYFIIQDKVDDYFTKMESNPSSWSNENPFEDPNYSDF